MAKYASGVRVDDLSLVEMATPLTDSPSAADMAPSVTPVDHAVPAAMDRFLVEATQELESGHVDQPLWTHAVVQAGGDEKLARPAYLRARATALRVEKRNKRAVRVARHARAMSVANGTIGGRPGRGAAEKYSVTGLTRKQLAWLTGILSFLVVAAALIALRSGGQAPPPASVKARPASQSGPSAAVQGATPGAVKPDDEAPRENFPARIQALKEAGNWNVVVLYAAEWTRKQPGNADAWRELSAGYLKLHQFNDAFDAAGKGVSLAPGNAAQLQNLGQVNLALNDLPAALAAFDKAAELNQDDVPTLVQVGTLNMQLGHLPASRIALTKALALSPGNIDAMCASVSLAQRDGRAKDAEAITREVSSAGERCRDPTQGESTSVTAVKPPKAKPTSSPAR